MGTLSPEEREAVLAKARADAAEVGLPPSVEDVGARKGIGGLLIKVRDALGKGTRSGSA
jgi:hypothetical protein